MRAAKQIPQDCLRLVFRMMREDQPSATMRFSDLTEKLESHGTRRSFHGFSRFPHPPAHVASADFRPAADAFRQPPDKLRIALRRAPQPVIHMANHQFLEIPECQQMQ